MIGSATRCLLAVLSFALVYAAPVQAAPADLDETFGVNGVFAGPVQSFISPPFAYPLALDHLQRPVLAVLQDTVGDGTGLYVAVMRLTTEGDLDPTFNPLGAIPGVLSTGFAFNACDDGTSEGPVLASVATTPDHHIVIAATICGGTVPVAGLLRIDENGALDDAFDGDGKLVLLNYAGTAADVAVDASERIYLAGLHCIAGAQTNCQVQHAYVTRFSSTGVRDQSFNAGGTTPGILEYVLQSGINTRFNAIHVLSDDSAIAVGGASEAFVARISASGERVTTFGPAGDPPGTIDSLLGRQVLGTTEGFGVTTTDSETTFLVTGQSSDANGAALVVAKLTATGALDTSFAPTATVPGTVFVPGGYHGSQVKVQPDDGKVVVMGWGPNATFSDNRILIARLGAGGVLDPSFGTGGVAVTPLGSYSLGLDGEIQDDGKILLAGLRRSPPNDIAGVVIRYLGEAATPTATPGGAGTATPSASGGTLSPTPVATATPSPTPTDAAGEVCGNCLDDEHDGFLDRDDAECPPRANGNGQGVGTPKIAGKAVAKCSKGIESAATKFAAAKLQSLQTCVNAVFTCIQNKPADPKCLPKAGGKCTKETAMIVKDRAKLVAAIAKACPADKVVLADVVGAAGLGFGAETGPCAVGAFGALADVAECIRVRHECAAEQELALEVPRAAELLLGGGIDPAVSGVCLLGPAPALGTGLADAGRAKLAVKCQVAITKAGLKFGSATQKSVQTCLQATTACIQEKPDDVNCLGTAHFKCVRALATLGAPGGVDADLLAAIAKDCGALTADELMSPTGLGFQSAAAECSGLGTASVATAAGVGDCLRRQHGCRVGQALEASTPRRTELLGLGGVTVP